MKIENMELLKPITINGMTLKNRLGNAPFGSVPSGDGDGYINDNTIGHCRTLIESGVGMLMTGPIRVYPEVSRFIGSSGVGQDKEQKRPIGTASLVDDSYIESWKKLVDFAHSHDCKLGIQLGEWGPQALNSMSDLKEENKKYKYLALGQGELPEQHIMTVEELEKIIEYTAQGALRAQKAGIDCVELHAAHSTGLLFANALDPFFNNRDDEYGGDVGRRLNLLVKTIKRIREVVGPDYPLLVRINGDDLKGDLGHTSEDVCRHIVPVLEAAGVDAIDVSMGGPMYETQGPLPPVYYPRGCWMYLARAIKQDTKLPVIGVGRITTIEMAEKYLREGWADIIYMGRQIFADQNTLQNFIDGKKEYQETRQCIACLKPGCIDCSVNYDRFGTMRPGFKRATLDRVENPKKVLVVGGGVAGMEAARVAALKGHKVTLWEREGNLGGIVATLATTPLTSEFQNIVDYGSYQLSKLEVDVRCCCVASVEKIKAFAPDVCILATGAEMPLPDFLQDGLMVMSHLEAMKRKREFRSLAQWKKEVVVYGFTAAEFAIDLSEAGANVTLMGPAGESSIGSEGWVRRERKYFLQRKLTDINYIRRTPDTYRVHNPRVLTHAKLEGVGNDGVHYYHNGIHKTMPYDVLIYSGGRKKNDDLFEAVQQYVSTVHKIGDCDSIGNITTAIQNANDIARNL
ncbi:MAG: NAD(P)/FAD-dependent oxidoreductase [Treponema sp.]|jgi:2,4-dienoyl-CoA reductase (NADPH2)|nr:NAD(P)/FAD-dependent oxidoreductase [Treponema sp.]